ncbi:MAG: hypothetical protein U0166_15250 [Acidobacteriota bacterium]
MRRTVTSLGVLFLLASPALAQDHIDITHGVTFTPIRIAIPDFKMTADRAEVIAAADELHDTIVADLEFTGLFEVIDPSNYRDMPNMDPSSIDYAKWDFYNAQGVATGSVGWDPVKELYFQGRLFDVKSKAQVFAKEFTGKTSLTRKMAHIVAQLIIETFWGQGRGFATAHVVFVGNRTGIKEVYAMDYDGQNQKQLTSSRFPNLVPACSPDGKYIAYTSYKKRNPDLYLMDLKTGESTLLHATQGQSMSPDWTPDSRSLIFTSSKGDVPGTCLWMIDVDGSNLRQITNGRKVDCSAAISHKTGEVVFTSDRTGLPQIYTMSALGSDQTRVPLPGEYNDAASFSPDNTQIVFQSRMRGNAFDIYVYDVASQQAIRIVDPVGSNENPAWSPDGRFVVFSGNRTGKFQLYMVRATGSDPVKLTNSGDNETPCFCP